MEKREQFSTRLGFILISAGCAIGLGNVWRFPYITGLYGGGLFVLLYLFFLVILGLPIVVCEFAVGRASQKSVAMSFNVLEPEGSKWHIFRYFAMAGSYLLMMFYTTIGGWMLAYLYKMITGELVGATPDEISESFSVLTQDTNGMILWMVLISIIALLICSLGLEKGVEGITKKMMTCLIVLMGVLAVRAVTLEGALEGLQFFLVPNVERFVEAGMWEAVYAALGQAFFTLSVGIGGLSIFGSFLGKERSLLGEAICVAGLDTGVALVAGLIIFPTCFAFGVDPGEGAGLVFITLPNIFNEMVGGQIWGILFFLFMTFAALSTVVGVYQCIITFARDLWGWSLKKSTIVNGAILIILSIPCVLGLTVWSDFTILGKNIMDTEDFIVSSNLLPLGSMVYLLFCMTRYGWGYDNFIAEANAGEGLKFPNNKFVRTYLTFVLPAIVLYVFIQGYIALLQ